MLHRITLTLLTGVLALVLQPAVAQIKLAGITEGRGPGATAGQSLKSGYLMAIDEINGNGGVLGQQLELTQFDIDTSPAAAEEATKKALVGKPFAVLGPQFSGITAASMKFTADPAVPQFTGGEASSLTRRFHPSLLRTSLSQSGSMPRLGALATFGLGAQNIGLIWIDNDFGKDGRDALIATFKRRKTVVGFDGSVKPAQTDCAQVVAALIAAKVDALLLYATESESIEVLKELRKQGFDKPIVTDGLVAAQKVIDAAGGATEGVLVHMNNSVDAPSVQMQAFVKRYEARYGRRPDLNGIKGYFSVQLLKAGLTVTGELDQAKFLHTVHNTRFEATRFPDLLGSVAYDFFGDLNRASYFAVIRNGRPQIVATISALEGGMVELPNGQLITLNSAEFRRELASVVLARR
ncbi:ABC transporter substrate-binding protein [Variovorax sp. J22P168]|uniref:ABC transporter substrate-binding protein n=1 Tax=Variovorax jilinensis TaxID=3053513 RepID=UPI0025791719|nr:ABC transporter substrate-binding protein [Variovorax sp. J22P168]MDM0014821.1 ABC transporter substrate-binding protein [Variovorax sp. J22P168]